MSALESTSTIIKIHNSTKKEIRVTDENDKTKLIKFDPDENSSLIQKEVKKYVTFTGEVLNCKCVDIYFPVPMLKVGLSFRHKVLLYLAFFFMLCYQNDIGLCSLRIEKQFECYKPTYFRG